VQRLTLPLDCSATNAVCLLSFLVGVFALFRYCADAQGRWWADQDGGVCTAGNQDGQGVGAEDASTAGELFYGRRVAAVAKRFDPVFQAL
jgi:hypothetical protein